MNKIKWTGHPFVDAGLAAIAARAKVDKIEDLTEEHLETAVKELKRILLSDQAMGLGVGGKAFVKGPMSQLFPNSELVNPSNWKGGITKIREKFCNSLQSDLDRAIKVLKDKDGDKVCNVCGRKIRDDAVIVVRKDKMPLLEGIVNFYPSLSYGTSICGVCALAIRFLPMSVMRTGVSNRLWFLHTLALPIVKKISKTYGWQHFDRAIAANEPIDFYSKWETAGEEATVLYLLFELLNTFPGELRKIYHAPLPVTAYIFSNDNRGGFIRAMSIPNDILNFLGHLQAQSISSFKRFWQDLLKLSPNLKGKEKKFRIKFIMSIAYRLVNTDDILASCLNHEHPKLLGGWWGHRVYLQEVRKMATDKLAILENLALSIAQSDEAKKYIMELREAKWNELYGIFLKYVRDGLITHQEFYTLLPPNDYNSASEIRDILLAIIYDWQHCQETGKEFPELLEKRSLSPDETLKNIQRIGDNILNNLSNPSRWIGQLQTARSSDKIRATYLNAVKQGALRFDDFVFLAPLENARRLWLLRDYLLAFLFERVRIEVEKNASEKIEIFNEGGES